MYDTQEIEISQDRTYSRRQRSETRRTLDTAENLGDGDIRKAIRPRRFRIGAGHHVWILFLSLILTATSVVLPFFETLATDFQQFNLYTGGMMMRSQYPFSDIFATGGFLYYTLIGISKVLGSSLYLLLVQFLALYVAGGYFYKILLYLVDDASSSMVGTTVFYLANFSLGFGGLYPMQWAMPFLLAGLWFLIRYFAGIAKDEGFIGYGLNAALAIVLEPRTLLFWLVAFLFLSLFNISKSRWARGFYQNLGIVLGLMLVLYTVGYFIFNLELLMPSLSQAVVYNFSQLAWGDGLLWQTALWQIGALFFTGGLLGLLMLPIQFKKFQRDRVSLALFGVVTLLYLVWMALSQSWALYLLLPALPFGLLLTISSLDAISKRRLAQKNSHRSKDEPSLWRKLLMSHLAGPLVLVVLGFALPFYQNLQDITLDRERAQLVTYLENDMAAVQELVVVDTNAEIYLSSDRRSSTAYPVSTLYQSSASNLAAFEDEFLGSQSEIVIVNKAVNLSKTIADRLDKSYEAITPAGIEEFTVYQLK
ncbi:hypothetical protein [Streptococcus plurextorum]|uniref:hypothetical protein n=1 Tax=Streptococcus plurextorum TaxID=456876 RepID=UPI00041D1DE3|nr:hypothetical protein [Streptococcus plurextorum]